MAYFLECARLKTGFCSTHKAEQLLSSVFYSIMNFDFDLILGLG